jgi:hypothetical protein
VAGCFVAWGIAHELLAHPISVNWQPSITLPASHPLISARPTFTDPKLDADGIKLKNDLSSEFGGAVSEATLEYLIKVFGTSPKAAAMIRCLYQNGYLGLSKLYPKNTSLIADYDSSWSAINDHLKPNDLGGAWKENNPDQVDPATIDDPNQISGGAHDKEVESALKSLDNVIERLESAIQFCNTKLKYAPSNRLTDTEIADLINKRDRLQKLKDAFEKLRDFVQNTTKKGSPSPDTWPDKGKLPLVDDLLQASTCNVTYPKYIK